MELEYYQNEDSKKLYMFLMMAWAVISDCDINSEVIRCCGPPRFTLWGVMRVFFLRHYPGFLSYKGASCKTKEMEPYNKLDSYTQKDINKNFKVMCIYNAPWIAQAMNAAPLSKIDDGTNDITFMTQE